MKLTNDQQKAICLAAHCQSITDVTPMQSLWAGQGELARLSLAAPTNSTTADDSLANKPKTLVVKQIVYTTESDHPRGWNTDKSQQRKRRSYDVELDWYRQFSSTFNQAARMPELVYSECSTHGVLLVLEDLDVEYPVRFTDGKNDRPTDTQIQSCIQWLARFHARTLNHTAESLWPVGGYWHLATRPDEWQAMEEGELKQSAHTLDTKLNLCTYQSIIHGDAKLANFCFNETGEQVAAVDFQYVGKGPGIKDLMLLLSSVLPDERLMTEASGWLEHYFEQLSCELNHWQPDIDAGDVVSQWRALYPIAWADFHRFASGWSPGHWKIGTYCQQQTELAIRACEQING